MNLYLLYGSNEVCIYLKDFSCKCKFMNKLVFKFPIYSLYLHAIQLEIAT